MKFPFKKSSPGVSFVPDLPKASLGSASTNADFTPLKKTKHGFNKKVVVGLGVLLSLVIVGLTAYIATRPQPQTTNSKAAAPTGCTSFVVGSDTIDLCPDSVQAAPDKTSAKAVFHLAFETNNDAQTSVTLSAKQTSYWCNTETSTCQDNPNVTNQNYTLDSNNPTQIISMSRDSDGGQACGVFQFDVEVNTAKLSQSVSTGVNCNASLSPSPSQPAPVPPGSTIAPSGTKSFSLSGVIYSSATPPVNQAASCTPSGTGLNGVDVSLTQNGVVLQKDTTHNSTNVGSLVPGNFAFNTLDAGTYSVCIAVPSGSQISCPASIGGNSSNCFTEVVPNTDTNSPIVIDLASISAPSSSPSTAPSGSPSPSNSVGRPPTPTTKVVVITATPTPTTIIVVGATNTPGPTSVVTQSAPTASPSIPSAGSPLPYVAVAIPFVLILIAFIL